MTWILGIFNLHIDRICASSIKPGSRNLEWVLFLDLTSQTKSIDLIIKIILRVNLSSLRAILIIIATIINKIIRKIWVILIIIIVIELWRVDFSNNIWILNIILKSFILS